MIRRISASWALFVIATAVQPGWSQESRGAVLGRVTDSSGSVVPGATIQITNVETGVTLKGATNGEGNYFFPFLIPGMYSVTAERAGFKRIVRSGIEVN